MAEGKKRIRSRVRSKIDELPRETRLIVDGMVADVRYTYKDISAYLAEEGYDISYGAVFRYAARKNNATQRLLEAQEQTRAICEAISKNPNMDYTEGVLQIAASGLTQKIASAQEEWDEMELSKAVDTVVKLSRAKGYKDKVYSDLNTKVDIAVKEFEQQIFEEISDKDPKLAESLKRFAEEFAEKIQNERGN